MPENNSRFAEMAMELMGSKMAHEFITQVWEAASPRVKKELADKVMAALTEQIKASDWNSPGYIAKQAANDRIRSLAHEVAQSYFDEHKGAFLAEVKVQMEASWKDAVMAATLYVLDAAAAKVRETIRFS